MHGDEKVLVTSAQICHDQLKTRPAPKVTTVCILI